jgi:hypothetical protein
MEININEFVQEWQGAWMDFSASAMEIGNDASQATWTAAKEAAEALPILKTTDQLNAAIDYFEGFGAWSREELDAMTDQEVNALLIQFIAGEFREAAHYDSFEEYSENVVGGNLYQCDVDGHENHGEWFFYLGM